VGAVSSEGSTCLSSEGDWLSKGRGLRFPNYVYKTPVKKIFFTYKCNVWREKTHDVLKVHKTSLKI